jgi:hypothetical protein
MKEYLQEMCTHIANRVSWLYKIARNTMDPTQEAPEAPHDIDKEDMKVAKDISKKEFAKLEKEQNKKYEFLFYYDDYFETNKDYVGMRPATPKSKGKKVLK